MWVGDGFVNHWYNACMLRLLLNLLCSVLAGSEKYLALEHCKSLVVLTDVSLKSYVTPITCMMYVCYYPYQSKLQNWIDYITLLTYIAV